MLSPSTRARMLECLLVMQRHSWEQGVTAAALHDLGRADLVSVLLADSVARQLPDGRLAELDDLGLVNSGALGEVLHDEAVRSGNHDWTAASRRQEEWLLVGCPRTPDGTLFHLADRREVWADTVYMVVPALAAYGRSDAARAQLDGHRARLRDPNTGLWRARWHEDEQRILDRHAWATANGWVAAALVRTIGRFPESEQQPFVAELRELLDCCLRYRRPDGLFGNLLDDPGSFSDASATAMLAYGALRGATEGWLPPGYADVGMSLLDAVTDRVDELGRVTGACAAPHFQQPGFSPEAQAFALLADAAHVRWLQR